MFFLISIKNIHEKSISCLSFKKNKKNQQMKHQQSNLYGDDVCRPPNKTQVQSQDNKINEI